jgi:hypothetical protein
MTKFYCLRFETPSTWRTISSYFPGTGWPGYTPRHWVPFSSPPTTRRATMEVSNMSPHGRLTSRTNSPLYIVQTRTAHTIKLFFHYCLFSRCRETACLHSCFLATTFACLHSCYLITGLHVTIQYVKLDHSEINIGSNLATAKTETSVTIPLDHVAEILRKMSKGWFCSLSP